MDLLNKSSVSEEEVSPTVSRFGRTRKPKISSDFCDIDEIFQSQKREAKSPVKVTKPVKQTSFLKPVKKVQVTANKKLTLEKDLDIYLNAPKQITPLKTEQVVNKVNVVKVSGDSIKNRKFFKSKPPETDLEDDIDVSKVMKLVVGKTEEQTSRIQKHISGYRKNLIKTYSNKRRAYNRPSLESFGLPDEPIIPIIESNVTKPKRIQSLDIGKPSRDVTLIDSKVNSQWQPMIFQGPNNPKTVPPHKITIAKTTKAIQGAKIAQQIDENLRLQNIDLRKVINVNSKRSLDKSYQEVYEDDDYEDMDEDDEDGEVIELDDDDEFRVLTPSKVSTPLNKNKIIIHSNELIAPAKKLPPKVKILEDIVFKNSTSKTIRNNNFGKGKLKMSDDISDELENESSGQQFFNLNYSDEAPVEDLVGGNVVEEIIFDSTKEHIAESADSHSLHLDSDSICSNMSVENISLPNENTIITYSPVYTSMETVVPAAIDEETYCELPTETFDGNEETVFTTVDNNILCADGQESPVLILINKGEDIIIESNMDAGGSVKIGPERKENEESSIDEDEDFNLQIDLENPKISEQDGGMIVLDENMVGQLGEGYIILQGDIDTKDVNTDDGLTQIAILNPDIKDDMEGTQYILQCTASEDLQELVIDTSDANVSEPLSGEPKREETSTSSETLNLSDTKNSSIEYAKDGSINKSGGDNIIPKKRGSAIMEFMKSPEDNLPINRKSYKTIREKIRLEARNLLNSKGPTVKKLAQSTTLQKGKNSSSQEKDIETGEKVTKPNINSGEGIKSSPKRNKDRKLQDSSQIKVSAKIDVPEVDKETCAHISVKSEVLVESGRRKKNSMEIVTQTNKQYETKTTETPITKKTSKISVEESNKPNRALESPQNVKIVREENKDGKQLSVKNESEKDKTPSKKKRTKDAPKEECKSSGRKKIIKETSIEDIKQNSEETQEVINKDLSEQNNDNETEKVESQSSRKSESCTSTVEIAKSVNLECEKHETPRKKRDIRKHKDHAETDISLASSSEQPAKKSSTPKNIKADKLSTSDHNLVVNENEATKTEVETPRKRKTTDRNKKHNEQAEKTKPKMENNEENTKESLVDFNEQMKLKSSNKIDSTKKTNIEENLTSKSAEECIPEGTLNLQKGKCLKLLETKLKPRESSPGTRKSSRFSQRDESEIKIEPIGNIKQCNEPKGSRKSKSSSILDPSEECHQSEKINKDEEKVKYPHQGFLEKRKSSRLAQPNDKEQDSPLDETKSMDVIEKMPTEEKKILDKKKYKRISQPKDEEENVKSESLLIESSPLVKDNKAIPEKRKSSRFSQELSKPKEQEQNVSLEEIPLKTSSVKDKEMLNFQSSDEKIKEPNQKPGNKKISQEKRKSSRFSQMKDPVVSSQTATDLLEVKTLPEGLPEYNKLQISSDFLESIQEKESTEAVTEKRKSARFSQELKVSLILETSSDEKKSGSPAQEHISSVISPEDSICKKKFSQEDQLSETEQSTLIAITTERPTEKRKSTRISQTKEDNELTVKEKKTYEKSPEKRKSRVHKETIPKEHRLEPSPERRKLRAPKQEPSPSLPILEKRKSSRITPQDSSSCEESKQSSVVNKISLKTPPPTKKLEKFNKSIDTEEIISGETIPIKQEVAVERADKRKSSRLFEVSSQIQDQNLSLQITLPETSPDKSKCTKYVKDFEDIKPENTHVEKKTRKCTTDDPQDTSNIKDSIDSRKTRSCKDLELLKKENTQITHSKPSKKTRSGKEIESLKSEGIHLEDCNAGKKSGPAKKSECAKEEVSEDTTSTDSLKLGDISEDSRKTRSNKDIEGGNEAKIHTEIFVESRKTRSSKDVEGPKQENSNSGVLNDGRKTRSTRDVDVSEKTVSTESVDVVKPESIQEEVSGDKRKSSRLNSPKEHQEIPLDIVEGHNTSDEPIERRKSSRISSTADDKLQENLSIKKLILENENPIQNEQLDLSSDNEKSEMLLENADEPINQIFNIDDEGQIISPKKGTKENKKISKRSPNKKEKLQSSANKQTKSKEGKLVVRLKNVHNSWTNTNLTRKRMRSKSESPNKRTLRFKVSDDASPKKEVSPSKNVWKKKRIGDHIEYMRKSKVIKKNTNTEEKRRSARVSELKPISYSENLKNSGETSPKKGAISCSDTLKDIFDDVEFIKRAVLNSTQDDENDDKTSLDDPTKIKIKEEVLDDVEDFTLFNPDEIKKEIKEEPLDIDLPKMQSLKQVYEFNDGDLAYAKLGHFPYWPCLITQDPNTKAYRDLKINNKSMYHVRFFGDRGRRSWVRQSHVMPLTSQDDIPSTFAKLKKQGASGLVLRSYMINPKVHQLWQEGLNEALSLLDKSIEERYQFFFNMFATEREKLEKQRTQTPIYQKAADLEIKSEKLDEVLEDNKISPYRKPKKPKYSKSPIRKLKSRDIDGFEVELVRPKRGRPLKKEVQEEVGDEDVVELSKNGTSTPELKVKSHLSIIDLSSECSLSDTDSSSRWSIRTPIVCNNENQSSLYKRNSLFKGVQRDRVCQICLKPGEVYKCRGKCFGYYHKECSLLKMKVKVETEEYDSDCQIVLVKDKKFDASKKLTLNTDKNFREMTLAEQIDFKLKEIMIPMISKTIYADSTSDYTSSEDSSSEKCGELTVEHVTADDVILVNKQLKKKKTIKSTEEDFRCSKCASNMDPDCFVCRQETSPDGTSTYRQKCSIIACGKFFHPECLKVWPQTQISLHSTAKNKESGVQFDSFSCPMHMCHICVSDDPRASISRLSSIKIVRCLKCPATYHSNTCCIPAGTEIISTTQIICPRHLELKGKPGKRDIINTKWCFICSEGGDLICCETCPTSVHPECSQLTIKDDDTFICEECETGRLPLYDEIVWVKFGKYRWWPALILFPNEVPENIKNMQHQPGEFVVKFFGTHDHYWVNRGRVFLFQEGDEGPGGSKKRMDQVFKKAVEEAAEAHAFKTEFKKNMEDSMKVSDKPPPYIRIKVNKPVGNVKLFDGNISNTTPCNCNPTAESPCGADSYCINRLLLTECDPEVCPARERCQNQRFEKREYPPLVPYKTKGRGWGLRTLAPIKKGQFVIEYVGEVIDDQEYQRRMVRMHEQKDDNYYFLTIDKDRMIDAGPKGNVARFMNHCCEPNCETQKWTVKGDTRVGLFAKTEIAENTEVTFNYNLESVGEEKKVCRCGAVSCSGFIGVKVKNVNDEKKPKKTNKIRKKRSPTPVIPAVNTEPCFLCGGEGETFPCHNKICTKYYHLNCVKLDNKPDGKWSCPWHNCNLCSKRTIRCCVKCINSYCPVHSEGNVRHDKLLGFICTEHDPTKEPQEILSNIIKKPRNPATPTEESDVTSTTHEETEELFDNYSENSSVTKHDDTLEESFEQHDTTEKKKRGRRLKKKYPAKKRMKLDDSHKNMNILVNNVSTPEIILTSSVPERHLRTNRKVSEDSESERLLKRQRAYEKDLPIRKRTTPRTESTENK